MSPRVSPAIYPDLQGRVAVVTGGSKGIGAECCRMLARNGAKVCVVARSQPGIDALVDELRALGHLAIGMSADVTDPTSLGRVRASAEDELGPVDILLPYAGGFGSFTSVWETEPAEWRKVVEDNLTSTFLTCAEFIPDMIERRRGSIVTMSSISGRFLDKPTTASYAASKAGVIMYTRHAALELGPSGVRVNSIAPGTTTSERIDRIMDSEAKDRTAALSPLGRLGTPEDCAHATMFLASDVSAYLTGVTLDVTGGRVML